MRLWNKLKKNVEINYLWRKGKRKNSEKKELTRENSKELLWKKIKLKRKKMSRKKEIVNCWKIKLKKYKEERYSRLHKQKENLVAE